VTIADPTVNEIFIMVLREADCMFKSLIAGFSLALLATVSAANAATVSCGGDVGDVIVTLTTSTPGTCNSIGNGNNLNGVNDPVNTAGYLTLDTTSTSGLVALAFTLGNSGAFSFVASSLYTDYVLGIQTSQSDPKPDYFAFNLPNGVVSGSYSINDADTRATRAVLYGHSAISASPVPGPIVGAGLPGLVMALGGLIAWRRRRIATA
jgi:hypothetical protein